MIFKLLPVCLVAILSIPSTIVLGANRKLNGLDQLNKPFTLEITKSIESALTDYPNLAGLYLKVAIRENNIEAVQWILKYAEQNKGVRDRVSTILIADSILDARLQAAMDGNEQISESSALKIRKLMCSKDISAIDIGYLLGYEALTRCLIEWKLKNINDPTKPFCMDQLEMINYILFEHGLDINASDADMNTVLLSACYYNQVSIANLLVANLKVNVNLKCKSKDAAILIASSYGNLEIVQALLSRKDLDVNVKDINGNTSLHLACYKNQLKIVEALLGNPKLDLSLENKLGNTALMTAVICNHLEISRVLLKRLDVNAKDASGNTLLHIFCQNGYLEAVKVLLDDCRMNINLQNNKGHTAIVVALVKGNVDIVKVLLGNKKLNMNIKDHSGNTLLHTACHKNQLEIVKMLLDSHKVDLIRKNEFGYTAMMLAKHMNRLEILQLFENLILK